MVGNPSRTPQPAVDENPLSLPKRCKSLLIEEVRAAGHQEATVVVTSFKIIKFLVKSGFREEAGLGIAAGKGTCGMRWTGMRGNGQRLSPVVEGREEGAKGLRGAGRGVCWIGTGSPGCVFFLCSLGSFVLPSHSPHPPDCFSRPWVARPHPRGVVIFSGGVCDMTAFSLGKGHRWNTGVESFLS